MKLGLTFGAMVPPLREQLAGVKAGKVAHWQRDADAITRLAVRGLLPDAQVRKCRQKLMNQIAKEI